MPRFRLAALALLAACATLLAACAGTPDSTRAPPPIDLPAFMGTWYVIAHVPYFTDRGHVTARDEFTLREDGSIGVHYVYRTGFAQPWKALDASASVRAGSGNRAWRMRFYKVVPANYRILEVAADGRWALVDSPGHELAWVLARTPHMDDAQYQQLLQRLRGYGIDTDKLWRVPQVAEQVGKLGFDRPNDP